MTPPTITTATILGAVAVALIGGIVLLTHIYIVPKRLKLRNKNVIITGGSSGIGKEIARECLRRGAHIILVARSKSKLLEAQKELLKDFPDQTILIVSQDVSEGVLPLEAVLRPAIAQLDNRVDVLVNCAGTSVSGAFDSVPEEAFEDMFKVNVLGSVYPTRAVLPFMKQQPEGGSIVFVSSQAGQVGIWGYSAYSASKFALRGLAQALQMEVHPYHIHISVAYPPDTDTPGFQVEELSKPKETSLIVGPGNVFTSEQVAKDLINGVCARSFNIYTGLDGFMLSTVSAGMEPVFSWVCVCVQVLLSGLFRFIALFYLIDFYRTSAKCRKERLGLRDGVGGGGGNTHTHTHTAPKAVGEERRGKGGRGKMEMVEERDNTHTHTHTDIQELGVKSGSGGIPRLLRRKTP